MMSVVDVEEVRGRLETLMTETSFRGSIRKQIVTLRERNRIHKKRINVENRVLKNLENQGILEKIIDSLLNTQDPKDLVDSVKDSKSISPDVHSTTSAKNNKCGQEKNGESGTKTIVETKKIVELKTQVSKSCSSFSRLEAVDVLSKKTETPKTFSTSLLYHKNTKDKKEKVQKKKSNESKSLFSNAHIEKDVQEPRTQKVSLKDTSNYLKRKEKVHRQKSESKTDVTMQKLGSSIHSSYSTGQSKLHLGDISENKSNTMLVKINPRKRHLHFEILEGKSFLEHLLEESFSMFMFFLYFRGQRFWTQPIPCSSQPKFDAGFLFELHINELVQTQMIDASQLLHLDEKIHIVLVRTLPSGEKVLVSSHYFEWRQILNAEESQKTFIVKLMGVGAESNVSIGIITVRLTLIPKLVEPLTEKVILSQCQIEKRKQEDEDRIFLVYAKTWWKEYLCIRPEHSRRIIKLFHQDENSQNRPVFHFVQVMKVGRPLLELPQEAAWFVSLIPFETSLLGTLPDAEQWWVPHTFLCLKKGVSDSIILYK